MNAIVDLLKGKNAISTAVQRRDRIKEIEARMSDLSDPRSEAQRILNRCQNNLEQFLGLQGLEEKL